MNAPSRRWVLASGNRGKLREFRRRLSDFGIELVAQAELGVAEIEETGETFRANALLKAEHAHAVTGLPALADDSGLSVAALGGAPGVRSARYAGEAATDADNVRKLLAELEGQAERGAYFSCVLAFVAGEHAPPEIFDGRWHGEILEARRGEGGFGYDPVFWVPGEACSAAELDLDVKNRLSHRGQAMAALIDALTAGKLG